MSSTDAPRARCRMPYELRQRCPPPRVTGTCCRQCAHLLERIDLLVATRAALLPRHAAVDAHGLELLELVQRVLEDFLLGPKVSLSLSQTAPFIIS